MGKQRRLARIVRGHRRRKPSRREHIGAADPARNRGDALVAHNVRAELAGGSPRTYRAPGRRWGSVLGIQLLVRICTLFGRAPARFVLRFVAYRLRYLKGLHAWPTFSRGWTERMAVNLLLGAA